MTCIVGLAQNGKVYMAADSAGVSGWSLTTQENPKLFRVGKMLIGFTTSFRMGQLLGYTLKVPLHPESMPVEEYMATLFVDAVRECLKKGGYTKVEGQREEGGIFLVGYRGRLFKFDCDFHIGESADSYAACGCGEDLARGAMYALSPHDLEPTTALAVALGAAERHSIGVRGPFRYEVLE